MQDGITCQQPWLILLLVLRHLLEEHLRGGRSHAHRQLVVFGLHSLPLTLPSHRNASNPLRKFVLVLCEAEPIIRQHDE